jgi:hypothetical protein
LWYDDKKRQGGNVLNNHTGEKIQNIAEVLFVCAIVLSVIAGIAYFAILRGGVGFFVCLLIVAAGIFGAFVYRYLMRGFGEIVEHQAEQTQLLLRMTEYLKTAVVDSGAAQTGTGKPYHTGAYQPPYQAPLSTDVVPTDGALRHAAHGRYRLPRLRQAADVEQELLLRLRLHIHL